MMDLDFLHQFTLFDAIASASYFARFKCASPVHDQYFVSCVPWISFYEIWVCDQIQFLCVRSKQSTILSEKVKLTMHLSTPFLPWGTCWIFCVPWQMLDDDLALKVSSFLWDCIQVVCPDRIPWPPWFQDTLSFFNKKLAIRNLA